MQVDERFFWNKDMVQELLNEEVFVSSLSCWQWLTCTCGWWLILLAIIMFRFSSAWQCASIHVSEICLQWWGGGGWIGHAK